MGRGHRGVSAARRLHDARIRVEVDRARGAAVMVGRTAASQWLETIAPDLGAVPSTVGSDPVQDPITRAFYFLLDYSELGGGDVLR